MRTITVRIISMSDDEAEVEVPDPEATDSEDKLRAAAKKKKKTIAITSTYITAQLLATAKSFMSVGYNRYLSLSEDYIAQTATQNMEAHLNRAGAVIGSAISGGLVGAKVGGPIGAIIGVAFGMTLGSIRNELTRVNTLAEQTRAMHEEAYSLYFNTARAGMINYSRGTEN